MQGVADGCDDLITAVVYKTHQSVSSAQKQRLKWMEHAKLALDCEGVPAYQRRADVRPIDHLFLAAFQHFATEERPREGACL